MSFINSSKPRYSDGEKNFGYYFIHTDNKDTISLCHWSNKSVPVHNIWVSIRVCERQCKWIRCYNISDIIESLHSVFVCLYIQIQDYIF